MAGAQTSYAEQLAAYAGLRYGMNHRGTTGVNDAGTAKQVHDVVVTAASAQTYTITITDADGVVHTIEYTAVGGDTITIIRNRLIDAARALLALEGEVTANPVGTDTIRFTAYKAGRGFTLAESEADLTNTAITANGTLESIRFGRGVIRRAGGGAQSIAVPTALTDRTAFRGVLEREHHTVDPQNPSTPAATPGSNNTVIEEGGIWVPILGSVAQGQRAYCVVSPAADRGKFRSDPGGTAQVSRIAVATATNNGVYRVLINGVMVQVTADPSATVPEVVALFVAEINRLRDQLMIPVSAVDANPNVDITALEPGLAFMLQEFTDPGTDISVSTVTPNVAGVAFPIDAEFESAGNASGLAKLMMKRPQPGANVF